MDPRRAMHAMAYGGGQTGPGAYGQAPMPGQQPAPAAPQGGQSGQAVMHGRALAQLAQAGDPEAHQVIRELVQLAQRSQQAQMGRPG